MKIAITGSSGLLGTAITRRLQADGHAITRVVRSRDAAAAGDAIYWSPASADIDAAGLGGHGAVINLAGENIAGVWTDSKKRRIRDSRVDGTRLLAATLAHLPEPARPHTLISASAAPGFFGDRPSDEPLDESAPAGEGFFATVVREWEAATEPARDAGVRVVVTRFGLVLDPDALLLRGAAAATRLGLGAKLGRGDQVFAWVSRREVAEVTAFLLGPGGREIEGPVHVVAPQKVTNEEFADTLARVLDRPRFLAIPAPALRLAGGLGDEVLNGAWVVPSKLERAGYEWRDPELEAALREMLRR